ncbi:MAG: AraC family transcriptional regulator [Syntrophomonadaceae bacterium]|jgi:hypothetical protein|nr:AraC family transcriptional regulator [Syntrophomonadaceae bacterium]
MKGISEKVSYLQGLYEGLNVSETGSHGKILSGLLQVMEEMAETVENMQQEMHNMEEYLEDLDEEIMDLEEKIWGAHAWDEDILDIKCHNCGEQLFVDTGFLDDDVLEITCPNCNTVVYINDGFFDFETDSEEENARSETSKPS